MRMKRTTATLAALVAASACAAGCSRAEQPRYGSLPKTCQEALNPPKVKTTLGGMFYPTGAFEPKDLPKLPGSDTITFFETLNCTVGGKWVPSTQSDEAEPMSVSIRYARYKQDANTKDPVGDARKFFKPEQGTLHGATTTDEPTLGDEGLSWWDDSTPGPTHHTSFRISNITADVSAYGTGATPQDRERIAGNTWRLSFAIAEWLKNDWKG